MYEHRRHPLLPRKKFYARLAWHAALASGLLLAALAAGTLGYHVTEDLPWIDALLNASMILGGMGPVHELKTDAGKLFASAYALFSGVFFLAVVGVLLAPIAHRFLHQLHLDLADDDERRGKDRHTGG